MITIRQLITQFAMWTLLLLVAINTSAADSSPRADLNALLTQYGYAGVGFKKE